MRVSWEVEESGGEEQVAFSWTETGGPRGRPPGRQGFGTRLLTKLVSYELDGEAGLEHADSGVRYRLDFPVPAQ